MPPFAVVERNLRHSLRFFARANANGEIRELPGVSLISSGVDFAVFNPALLSSPVTHDGGGLGPRIEMARAHFGALRLRWSCWVCEDLLDDITRTRVGGVFAAQGMRMIARHPGMIAERLGPPSRPLPVIEIRPVADTRTRADFCQVTSRAFDLPLHIAREIYDSERAWENEMRGYVGYLDRTPITTVAAAIADGAVGLYSVATLSYCRGRGYAEQMIRHALAEAQRVTGIERTVLESTRAGMALYRKLGYRQVTQFSLYVST